LFLKKLFFYYFGAKIYLYYEQSFTFYFHQFCSSCFDRDYFFGGALLSKVTLIVHRTSSNRKYIKL
jgi:hypothetical protein